MIGRQIGDGHADVASEWLCKRLQEVDAFLERRRSNIVPDDADSIHPAHVAALLRRHNKEKLRAADGPVVPGRVGGGGRG